MECRIANLEDHSGGHYSKKICEVDDDDDDDGGDVNVCRMSQRRSASLCQSR